MSLKHSRLERIPEKSFQDGNPFGLFEPNARRFAIFSSKTNLWSVFCNTHFKQLFEGKTAPGRTPGSLTQLQSWIGASQSGIGVSLPGDS